MLNQLFITTLSCNEVSDVRHLTVTIVNKSFSSSVITVDDEDEFVVEFVTKSLRQGHRQTDLY